MRSPWNNFKTISELFSFSDSFESYSGVPRIAPVCQYIYDGLGRFSNSYTMGWPSVRGDNPRALASGLSYVQVDKHGITILYHLHECRPCTSQDILC